MNLSPPWPVSPSFILALAVAAMFTPATAGAFDISAKLQRDGVGTSGPRDVACTFCENTSRRVSTSYSGGFPPPANPGSEISGKAFVDLATGVMRGSSHAVSYGNGEVHQMVFGSNMKETLDFNVPASLPAAERFVTFTGAVHAIASATNRASGTALYVLYAGDVRLTASLDHLTGWDVLSGENDPRIEVTPVTDGLSFKLKVGIPNSTMLIIESSLTGTARAEGTLTTGGGIADVNAGAASLRMTIPEGATYTSTSGVFLTAPQIEAWRQLYFDTSENSGPGADDADPDNDGTVNLLEFAMLTNPLIATALPIQQTFAGDNLEFTYTRNKAALGEVAYVVEWSDTPAAGSSSTAGVTEIMLSEDGTIQQIKATIPAGVSRRFVRLSVTRAGP